jgi:patatin-like phospholipase/acyl hydrolase
MNSFVSSSSVRSTVAPAVQPVRSSNVQAPPRKTEKQTGRKFRILSIDGGGIRGIIPATILWYLEEQLQERSGNPNARLSDYFDMMAGTSTGGILVGLYLTPDAAQPKRAKYSAKEALDLYLEDGEAIFSRTFSRKVKSLSGLLGKKYCPATLEALLQKAMGEHTRMSQLIRPCLIPAYNLKEQQPYFFRNSTGATHDFKTWEMARATSAAPTYFEPKALQADNQSFLMADGGLFAKNPALQAFLEAQKAVVVQGQDRLTADDILLVSIGTGDCKEDYSFENIRKKGAFSWLKPLMRIMMSTGADVMNEQLRQIFAASQGQYVRLEPCLHGADEAMDNACRENLLALYEAGLYYIERNKEMLDSLVEGLLVK